MKRAISFEFTKDEKIRDILPKQSEEKVARLREAIEKDGRFIDPLVVWEENGILLDGHTRLEVWELLPGDTEIEPPEVTFVSLPDMEAALRWVDLHQISRRNLTKQEEKIALGRLYNNEKKKSNGNAAKRVAGLPEVNQSPRTVRRAGKFVESVEKISEVNPRFAEELKGGVYKAETEVVAKVASLPKEQMGKGIRNLKQGRPWDEGLAQESAKPKKPHSVVMLEKAQRLLGDVGSDLYEACNSSDAISKKDFDTHLKSLNAEIAAAIRKVKESLK